MIDYIKKLFNSFKEYLLLALLLVVSLTLLSLNSNSSVKTFRTYAFGTFAFVSSGINSAVGLLRNDSEIERLRRVNAELMLEVNLLRSSVLENEKLRGLLALKDTTAYTLVSSDVISKLVSQVQGNYIINTGGNNGVETGMPVINEHGLIGIVTDVSPGYSVVRNIRNSSLKIAVESLRTGVNGILNWNGYDYIIHNIPTNFDIEAGDILVTSEFSTILPPSIPVGTVNEKESTVSGLLTNVKVKPFVDVNSINSLFVVKINNDSEINELKKKTAGEE